jgi:hypothetical protein
MLNATATTGKRIVIWTIVATLAALVAFLAFRGYLGTDLLLNFSNFYSC